MKRLDYIEAIRELSNNRLVSRYEFDLEVAGGPGNPGITKISTPIFYFAMFRGQFQTNVRDICFGDEGDGINWHTDLAIFWLSGCRGFKIINRSVLTEHFKVYISSDPHFQYTSSAQYFIPWGMF